MDPVVVDPVRHPMAAGVARRLAVLAGAWLAAGPLVGAGGASRETVAAERREAHRRAVEADVRAAVADVAPPRAPQACVGGMAGPYPCSNVHLQAVLPLSAIGGGSGNDCWGWTDPLNGKEYALVGRSSGTSFVDVSDPANPVYLGNLPTATSNSSWRDIKVHANHAYIVSEASGHGLQVFDLTQLRNVPSPPVTFAATFRDTSFGDAHNVAVDEATGFAYVVGSNTCSGGARIFDLQNPAAPTFAGCDTTDGYTHDTQCVLYAGPDPDHQAEEICFASNEDTLTIVNVTNKAAPVLLSRTPYTGSNYTHQGWLTEDQHYFLLGDELDEQNLGHNTRTYVWNVADLEAPSVIGTYTGPTPAIDHNLYVRGQRVFEANYRAGLRVLDLQGVASATLTETGYFDTYPSSNSASFNGAWSVYPYFPSGTLIVCTIEAGLFVLDPSPAVPVQLQSFGIE